MAKNKLTAKFFRAGVELLDPNGDTAKAGNVSFETMYPGGLYAGASMTIPRKILRPMAVRGADTVRLYNGLKVVYEGKITNPEMILTQTAQAVKLSAIGFWGAGLGARRWRKRWADRRIGDDVWVWQTTATAAEKCDVDRQNRIRFTPKDGVEWNSGEYAAVRFTEPTGETAKRVTWSYAFSETAIIQASKLWHFDSPATYTDLTNAYDGSASTSVTVTITTAGDYIYVGCNEASFPLFNFIRVDMGGTVNAVASVMTAEYYNTGWAALTITDGTASGGKTLAVDGDITFTKPADWDMVSVNSSRMYWVRLLVSVNLTASIVINEISIGQNQAWELALRNVGTSADVVSITANASSTTDHTFATPTQTLEARFYARAKQYGTGNGSIYAQVSSPVVYGETGNINLTEVAKDIGGGGRMTGVISTDESLIGSNTFDLAAGGFVADDWIETLDAVLTRAASFGDSSYNAWAVGVRAGDRASDGKPILFVEQQPALTDYDYAIRLSEAEGGLSIARNYDAIYNWIVAEYTDEMGDRQYVTPDDNSALKDATSISDYGQRDYVVSTGAYSLANATNVAAKFLAQSKDPKYVFSGPINIKDSIRLKSGGYIPACEIVAGKRIKIEDYAEGLTALISHTAYNDDTDTCSISAGISDDMYLAVLLSQLNISQSLGA